MLQIEDLAVSYPGLDEPILGGLSLSVPDRGLLALCGPSGCGKTTLLHALAGVLSPTAGRILFDGAPLSPKTVPIGLIPQNYGLLPWKTVRDNCLFAARARGVDASDRLEGLCGRLGLTPLLDRWPRELSGGQAQRVALARALLMGPRLLLLDEPFAALDEAAALTARELCLALCRESGCTAIVVTHRLEEALYLARSIAVMAPGGRLVLRADNPAQGREEPDLDLLRTLRGAVREAAG